MTGSGPAARTPNQPRPYIQVPARGCHLAGGLPRHAHSARDRSLNFTHSGPEHLLDRLHSPSSASIVGPAAFSRLLPGRTLAHFPRPRLRPMVPFSWQSCRRDVNDALLCIIPDIYLLLQLKLGDRSSVCPHLPQFILLVTQKVEWLGNIWRE